MNHLCCTPCRLRFAAPAGVAEGICAHCGVPLTSLAAREMLGYALSAPAHPGWSPTSLGGLADAVSVAMERDPG
jgi:hypothetical protein